MSIFGLALLLVVANAPGMPSVTPKEIADPRQVIALEEGTWDAVVTVHPRTASGSPTVAAGVQINELRSGGLWMLNRMSVNGGAYEGTGIWGFDARTGRYCGVWVDNGAVRVRTDDGTWNPAARTMTWTSTVERADGGVFRMRATSTFAGDRRIYQSFAITDSGDVPLTTVIFTRRRSPAGK